jgi:hypothetical protein
VLDVTVATKFLEDIFGDCPGDEWISVWAINREVDPSSRASQKVLWERVDRIPYLVRCVQPFSRTHCVFFGVATRKERLKQGRGGDDECVRLPALFADFDLTGPNHKAENYPPDEAALKEIMHKLPPASILVATGGGYHAYWKLNPPREAADAMMDLKKWDNYVVGTAAEIGYKVDGIFQLSRVLRLPGSLNCKNLEHPVPVKIVGEL